MGRKNKQNRIERAQEEKMEFVFESFFLGFFGALATILVFKANWALYWAGPLGLGASCGVREGNTKKAFIGAALGMLGYATVYLIMQRGVIL